MGDLIDALKATSATLAFDATGGGKLVSQILTAMEVAAGSGDQYSTYGSALHKQAYIYGGLDPSPTILTRNFGFAWGLGGWLLTPFLASTNSDTLARLRSRVAAGLKTTFASSYTGEISLAGMLDPLSVGRYSRQATGEKYLVVPGVDD